MRTSSIALSATLIVSGLLGLVLFTSSCGSDLTEVDRANVVCNEPCEIELRPSRRNRVVNSAVEVRNQGSRPATITDVRIEDSSPYVTFDDQMGSFASIGGLSEFTWTPQSPFTGFDKESEGFILDAQRSLELRIRVELPVTQSTNPNCPGGNSAQCGFVVLTCENCGLDDGRLRVPIVLSAAAGRISVDPLSLSMGDNVVAGSRYSTDFVVQNIGEGDLLISDVRIADEIPGLELREENNFDNRMPASISGAGGPDQVPGETRWTLTWNATQDFLDFQTTIIIESDDPDNPNIQIPVSATGGANAELELIDAFGEDLTRIDVPSPTGGEPSRSAFTVRNNGEAPLTLVLTLTDVAPESAANAFRVLDAQGNPVAGGTTPIPPQNAREFELEFNPQGADAIAAANGQIRFQTNDGNRPVVRIPFFAGEESPVINLSDQTLQWTSEELNVPQQRQLVIANLGRVNLNISDIELSGPESELFTFSESAPLTIGARSALVTEVTYTPIERPVIQAHRATLTFTSDDPNRPSVQASLSGIPFRGDTELPPTCVLRARNLSGGGSTFRVGDTIQVDASDSESNSGANLNLNQTRWLVISPSGEQVGGTAIVAATTTFTASEAGEYQAIATVTAGDLENQCDLNISVQN